MCWIRLKLWFDVWIYCVIWMLIWIYWRNSNDEMLYVIWDGVIFWIKRRNNCFIENWYIIIWCIDDLLCEKFDWFGIIFWSGRSNLLNYWWS